MVKVYVVDNGGQWTHREWRTLKYLDVDTQIVPNTISFDKLEREKVDGVVLSGGAPRIGLENKLGNCGEILEKADFPVLGICAGHQFMARFFGGEAKPAEKPEFGRVELKLVEKNNPIFRDVPSKSIVWESHNDKVSVLPESFIHLAESKDCKIQAMCHKEKELYGLQFHPEVENTEYGEKIFENFVNLCKKSKERI
ncbi:MAG: GMP synthase subunit A [Candidatus Thermoplasmatota archaeon]